MRKITMLKEVCLQYNNQIIKSIADLILKKKDCIEIKEIIVKFLACTNKQEIFGDMGIKLGNFLLQAETQHPELYCFIEKTIGINGLNEISQIIQLHKYCKSKKLNFIKNNLFRLCKFFVPENVFLSGKSLEFLDQSKIHTRFLNVEDRWKTRSKKKLGKINGIKKSIESAEENCNLNIFSCYHHNSEIIKEVLCELENKYQVFTSMKCDLMADEIKSTINRLNNDLNNQSLGFHRITLNSIAKNYNNIFKTEDDIKIFPIDQCFYKNNNIVKPLIDLCENFPPYGNGYAAFDHYAIIRTDLSPFGILVGERDTQTFFIGYYHE